MDIKENFQLPNGLRGYYIDSTHQYFVHGVEVPSITQLLDAKFGNPYVAVNNEILQQAADKGTAIHAELAALLSLRKQDKAFPIYSSYSEVQEYFNHIEPLYQIEPVLNEQIVALFDPDGNVVACGRFDMVCKIRGELALIDFKTTSALNKQHIVGQLNLYLKAIYQSGYLAENTIKQIGVIHLRQDKGRFVPFPILPSSYYLTFLA